MSQSVWPHDHDLNEAVGVEKALDELWCFVICPARPSEYWNDLFNLIAHICEKLGEGYGVRLRCRRAVDIVSAGIIHPEIWKDIRAADIVIADITGQNGNVMFELGVASAWLDKERVIIIREDREGEPRLFDINPARQIDYSRSPSGFAKLSEQLARLIQDGIGRAPFEKEPKTELVLPANLDLRVESQCRALWGPSGAHRRPVANQGLEFGSLYNFRLGWIAVGGLIESNVRVVGRLRFSLRLGASPYKPWMGIMLRSQGYFANSGHLALVRANGEVARTQEGEGQHSDVELGAIEGFDPDEFVDFDVAMSESEWRIRVGPLEHTVATADLPYVFSAGKILVLSQFCRVCLQSMHVTSG